MNGRLLVLTRQDCLLLASPVNRDRLRLVAACCGGDLLGLAVADFFLCPDGIEE
jgi:hypothetical protein